MAEILPTESRKRTDQPKIAIPVLSDHHSLGKPIVCSILRASGFQLTDFGTELTVREISQRAILEKTEILLISTLMLDKAATRRRSSAIR